jgi:polyisoprenoid-binding protein YceI
MNQRFASSAITAVALGALLVPPTAARAETMHLQVDTQKSNISATVEEPLSRFRDVAFAEGSFRISFGAISGDPSDVAATGHVELTIDLTTYSSGSERRDRTILSSSLETRLYPTATFVSTRTEKVEVVVPGAVGSATVVGNLTLHGETHRISVPVQLSLSPEGEMTGDGEVTFRYTDYGIKVPKLAYLISAGDEATIKFRIIAETPKAPASASTNAQGAP